MSRSILLSCFLVWVVAGNAKGDISSSTNQILSYSKTTKTLLLDVDFDAEIKWFKNGQLVSETGPSIKITESGVYTVKITSMDEMISERSVYVDVASGTMITLYIIGDSTVADYTTYVADYYETRYPLMGWGQRIYDFMVSDSISLVPDFVGIDSVVVDNRARGGQSTKTFFEDGHWTKIYNSLNPGDFVMMQFGHNDASVDLPKGIDTTGYKEYLTMYINNTREKGATPILITPVARNYPWSGGQLGNIHEDYWRAMRNVAKDLNVRLIDLTHRSQDFFTSKGQTFVTDNYFLNLDPGEYPAYPDGNSDGTHFNVEGAFEVANLVFQGLKEMYSVSLTKNIEEAGSVTGGGWHELSYQPSLYLTATPKPGYKFVKWQGDIESSNNPLTIDADRSNYEVEAVFEATSKPQYTMEYYIEGDGTIDVQPFGGLYEEGEDIRVYATPGQGFAFTSCFVDGVEYNDSEITINNVTQNKFLYALFIDDIYMQFPVSNTKVSGGEIVTNENYITGGECVNIPEGKSSSVSWTINSSIRAYTSVYFRYKNVSQNEITGTVYVNGTESREATFPPTDPDLNNWAINSRSGVSFDEGINTLEIKFDGSAAIKIDMLLIYGKAEYSPSDVLAIDGSVSLKDKWLDKVNIYPNPLRDKNNLIVEYDAMSFADMASLDLIDGQGRVVLQNIPFDPGKSTISIDTTPLNSGIYYLKLRSNQEVKTYKVILQ